HEDGVWPFHPRETGSGRSRVLYHGSAGVLCALAHLSDRGWPVDDALVERRTGAIDPLEIVEVEGGHHVHLEVPGQVAELAEEFLGLSS
ncbi:MAG: hypothetical protein ABEN55_19020, partial [Bradymonadaceae bacterium]